MEKFAIELLQSSYHPSAQEVAQYCIDATFVADPQLIRGHLAYCADCRRDVDEIRAKQKEAGKKLLAPSEHYGERMNEIILSLNDIYSSIALDEKAIEKEYRGIPKNKRRRLRPK